MPVTIQTEHQTNVVNLPRNVRIRRRGQGPKPWLLPVILVAMWVAYMVGRLSSY